MANKANVENVAADLRPPNWRAALSKLRDGLEKKKERLSSINGDISDIWAQIEGYKVNKKGARIFKTLDLMEPDDRADVLRSINGLIAVAGWPPINDLVDKADGAAPFVGLSGTDGGDGGDGGDDDGGEGSGGGDEDDDDTGGAQAAGGKNVVPLTGAAALASARARVGDGSKRKPAPGDSPLEPGQLH